MRITRQKDIFANTNRYYSLRKLSIGLASVLICLSFASATKIQTVKADSLNKVPVYLRGHENAVQNEMQQFSSVQNSVAEPQKNLLDNTENNQDSGQNLIDLDKTKQSPTDKNDAEKDIIRTSSLQEPDNHAEDSSQTQPRTSQKLDITKNNKKLAKKVLAVNLIETNSLPTTNGGFDEATWGKLDVAKWQGSVQDGVYQLTGYTGDSNHIIVPNEADFEKAGKSTNGLQVGITRDTVSSLLSKQVQTIAFSKTNSQKVKAIGTDWSRAFAFDSALSKFDGSNLDVSNVTDMKLMFTSTPIRDLTSLANWDTSNVTNMLYMFSTTSISDLKPLSNWDTSNVTNMSWMFGHNSISDLKPLANWDTSKVIDMNTMFESNSISDLRPLANWDTSQVTNMSHMFNNNSISNLKPLTNWKTGKVTNMNEMFANNSNIADLKPIANWDISGVINNSFGFGDAFGYDTQLDLTTINDTKLMQGFLKAPYALLNATFITNNVDLAKATIHKDLPTLTNTAKRTIVFNIPHAIPKTIVQIINYKAIAPVQINFNSQEIVQTYPVKESDWQLDTSNSNVTVNGRSSTEYKAYTLDPNGKDIDFAAILLPKIPGYKAKISRIPSGNSAQPAMFLVSFVTLPQQSQNNQSHNVQLPQKPAQPEQKQPEPIQTKPADDKQVDQGIDQISHTLMHNSSSNTDSFEPVQGDSTSLEASSDSTQNGDAAKSQKVNAAKPKKHIAKKHVVKKHKKHAKKYHLKRRARKHTKRVKYAKKRIIKHKKCASRKFRKYNLKHIKKS